MQVTIQGTVNSDVCEAGATHTVEWTQRLRGMVNAGLVVVTDWNPTPATDPELEPEPEPAVEQVVVEKPAPRPRGRRRQAEE